LDQVIEDAKPFRILAILNINQRTDLGGLHNRKLNIYGYISIEAHLKGNVIVANPNFKFLLANDILLGPISVVFPEKDEG